MSQMNSDENNSTDSSMDNAASDTANSHSNRSGYTPSTSSWQSPAGSSADMSVIGPSLVIKGELEAGEDLLIEGRVEGTITHTAERLLIGQRGTLKADIRARNVVIEGEVEGDVYGSESVCIRETAKVRGNIFTPKVSISEGAHFKGGIDMDVESVQKH
jgi:cytoskeletal protein CcmA (bactofilin family)